MAAGAEELKPPCLATLYRGGLLYFGVLVPLGDVPLQPGPAVLGGAGEGSLATLPWVLSWFWRRPRVLGLRALSTQGSSIRGW